MKHMIVVMSLMVGLLLTGRIIGAEVHQAVDSGDVAKLKKILLKQPDAVHSADKWGCTPLFYAARDKRIDMV
jgi:hypothetical protein